MNIKAYLIISGNKQLRVTKTPPYLHANEIAVLLNLEVPNAVFTRPIPVLDLAIPQDVVMNPDAELVARVIALPVAEALKVEIETVTDGLVEMVKERHNEQG